MQSMLNVKDFTCMLESISSLLLLRDVLLTADILQLERQHVPEPHSTAAAAAPPASHTYLSVPTPAG
jgi:hypothetical protein